MKYIVRSKKLQECNERVISMYAQLIAATNEVLEKLPFTEAEKRILYPNRQSTIVNQFYKLFREEEVSIILLSRMWILDSGYPLFI